jgi:hypothetical protein
MAKYLKNNFLMKIFSLFFDLGKLPKTVLFNFFGVRFSKLCPLQLASWPQSPFMAIVKEMQLLYWKNDYKKRLEKVIIKRLIINK